MISFLYSQIGVGGTAGQARSVFKGFGKAGICLIVICLAGCGSDKPPMSFDDETYDQFVYHFEEVAETKKEAIRSIDNDRIRLRAIVTDVYKPVIEDELGYDFDKTMRHYRFYRQDKRSSDRWWRELGDAYQYLANNHEEAYENKLISKEAYDLFAFEEKAGSGITDNQQKALDYILQCQELNDGVCTFSALNKLLPQTPEEFHSLVSAEAVERINKRAEAARERAKTVAQLTNRHRRSRRSAENTDNSSAEIEAEALENYRNTVYTSIAEWIETESGYSGLNSLDLIAISNEGFTVDTEKVEQAKQFTVMLEEEKQRLGLNNQG